MDGPGNKPLEIIAFLKIPVRGGAMAHLCSGKDNLDANKFEIHIFVCSKEVLSPIPSLRLSSSRTW